MIFFFPNLYIINNCFEVSASSDTMENTVSKETCTDQTLGGKYNEGLRRLMRCVPSVITMDSGVDYVYKLCDCNARHNKNRPHYFCDCTTLGCSCSKK